MANRQPAERRALGAWYTPEPLVARMVDSLVPAEMGIRSGLRVLDPACGDARLLRAMCDRLGSGTRAIGADIDPGTVSAIEDPRVDVRCVDGLSVDWFVDSGPFDFVIANPPFLSQMARSTSRGGSSRFGGGPYANTAMEFCLAGVRALRPGGRMAILLPQSVLTARDAAELRSAITGAAEIVDSWWSIDRPFDADVNVCMIVFERRVVDVAGDPSPWSSVVTSVVGVPDLPALSASGTIGDRARATANFRDEYYALVAAVADDADGPPLVTSGLIEPARCDWGERPVRFAKQRFARPRVALDRLEGRFRRWADSLLVPKVLVAAQTSVVEAVTDRDGVWIPGVPVISIIPGQPEEVHSIAAVLTSPIATLIAWHAMAGSGLAATSIRLSPTVIMDMPWPAGPLTAAVRALNDGDVIACGRAVIGAYGVDPGEHERLLSWWIQRGQLL